MNDAAQVFDIHPRRSLQLSDVEDIVNRIISAVSYRFNSVSRRFDIVENIEEIVDAYIEADQLAKNKRHRQSLENWIKSSEYKSRESEKKRLINAIAQHISKSQPFYVALRAIKATLLDHSQRTVLLALLDELGIITNVVKKQTQARKTLRKHIEKLNNIVNVLDISDLLGREYVLDDAKVTGLREIGVDPYGKFSTSGLSSGNAALIEQFSEIKRQYRTALQNTNISNVVLLIDEGDAFLHIAWQQKYVKFLNRFVESLQSLSEISLQVVLTTHSPVLMSDFPRDCIIKLPVEKYVDDVEKERKLVSFGATLQSIIYKTGGAGTMGDFSSEFIRELVGKIEDRVPVRRTHIDMIDDDVIRNALYALLDQEGSLAN
ncbi:AAA family ATPase [Cupriavidus oxalaticus]|uniref:AAA family ATPase n=1 Tax=Cupriavidus oxalaticus TaxID=96344 RepID=UPI0014386819|nr:AAA family ATPase [Cupriavidus oxalaticus]